MPSTPLYYTPLYSNPFYSTPLYSTPLYSFNTYRSPVARATFLRKCAWRCKGGGVVLRQTAEEESQSPRLRNVTKQKLLGERVHKCSAG